MTLVMTNDHFNDLVHAFTLKDSIGFSQTKLWTMQFWNCVLTCCFVWLFGNQYFLIKIRTQQQLPSSQSETTSLWVIYAVVLCAVCMALFCALLMKGYEPTAFNITFHGFLLMIVNINVDAVNGIPIYFQIVVHNYKVRTAPPPIYVFTCCLIVAHIFIQNIEHFTTVFIFSHHNRGEMVFLLWQMYVHVLRTIFVARSSDMDDDLTDDFKELQATGEAIVIFLHFCVMCLYTFVSTITAFRSMINRSPMRSTLARLGCVLRLAIPVLVCLNSLQGPKTYGTLTVKGGTSGHEAKWLFCSPLNGMVKWETIAR